jgi:hypothetical protein
MLKQQRKASTLVYHSRRTLKMYDVLMIGCWITGAAASFELSKYRGILERENDVTAGHTKANSAIVHAGYDPKPGAAMARCSCNLESPSPILITLPDALTLRMSSKMHPLSRTKQKFCNQQD